ncbi:ATP-binding protein [Mesorhizobium sp. M1B.F.Ca.ET.045.04.1.1]|uniref:ATP-binding protein n=1 Tax=Mesorhizobium sp. M1B.F.Ca.ET.045.04.1.1 TaxID=2493673 RepID=UPI0016780E78|nr:ATP-binding protein [Mesorhizobium sp. M1B.F.Ca.ET.045.04.1.1]
MNLETFRGQRSILQGASGSGKSNGARVLLEATYGKFQQLILDVEDEFHTLRTPEREYAIIGGDHGDAPLSKTQDAGDLALTLLKVGVSTILQIGDWTLEEKRSFIGRFVAGMMRAKSDLWHPTIVMLDETHLWAPQQGVVASSEAITHLATAGRKRGFGAIFATQRLSLINKDLLGQCENKFLGRVEQSADRRAVADLLGFGSRSDEAVDMQAFKPGEFYVVGPALAATPVRDRLFKASTEAPKPGSTVLPSATPAAIQRALAELVKASKEPTTPEKSPDQKVRGADPSEIATAERRGYTRGYGEGLDKGREDGFAAGAEAIRTALEEFLDRPRPPKIHVGVDMARGRDETVYYTPIDLNAQPKEFIPGVKTAELPMSPSSRKVVDAVVSAYPLGISLQVAAKRAGLSSRSSAFRKYLIEAAASPRIQDRGDGRYVAVEAEAGITAPPGLAAFKERLPSSYARMLAALEAAKGAEMDLDAIADRAEVSRTSSGLSSGLRELAALDLIVKTDGGYRLSPDFL